MKAHERSLPNIYDFSDYKSFLNAFFQAKKQGNRGFSTRRWCHDLGLKSPATLNMILRGKRNAGQDIVDRFTEYFRFSAQQRDYFENLVKLAKSKGDSERSVRYMEKLRGIHPSRQFHLLNFDVFTAVSNWYCFAIREMVTQPGFREDPAWISKKLRGKVSPKKVTDAIEALVRAKFLCRDANGFLKQTQEHIGTSADTANEAVKRFHEQMIGLALDSVRSVSVETRDISGSTFNIDPADLPALKADLRKLRQDLYRRYEKPQGPATYQICFQLFPLTEMNEETV